MAWTIGWLIATIAITLMWHSIDPRGSFWLICAGLASGVLLIVVAIQYWLYMIPFVALASLVGAAVWFMRQPQPQTSALARATEGRKN